MGHQHQKSHLQMMGYLARVNSPQQREARARAAHAQQQRIAATGRAVVGERFGDDNPHIQAYHEALRAGKWGNKKATQSAALIQKAQPWKQGGFGKTYKSPFIPRQR
jgi:hypothetical protein